MKKTEIVIKDGENPLDSLCIPFLEYFNSIGLKTIESCEGHNLGLEQPYEPWILHNGMFYIIFDETVSDEDIANFTKPHGYGSFLRGNFVKFGHRKFKWMYCLGDRDYKLNQANAKKDFEAFIAEDKEKYWEIVFENERKEER